MSHPLILNRATKAQTLYYDNWIRMYSKRRMIIVLSKLGNPQFTPYVKPQASNFLTFQHIFMIPQVRCDRIINDSLSELEMVVLDNTQVLKK